MNVNHYIQQHKAMEEEMKKMEQLLKMGCHTEQDAQQMATHINILAGKIRIHLLNEDQYLYPELIGRGEAAVSKMAQDYQKEMGDLTSVFQKFKEQYNTRSKILKGMDDFAIDAENIMKIIKIRIQKEEAGLYKLISK